eukprot:6384888-Pyramimonas_sp.AAC.1
MMWLLAIGRPPARIRCRVDALEREQPFPVDTASTAGSATPACACSLTSLPVLPDDGPGKGAFLHE